MKHNANTILTILICFFCVATNLYWSFHHYMYPGLFIKINVTSALLLILVVLLPTIQQRLKK